MAVEILTDCFVEVNGNDFSMYCVAMAMDVTQRRGGGVQEKTSFAAAWVGIVTGVYEWVCDLELLQDFADGGLDEKMFSLIGEDAVTFKMRPKNEAVSLDNPQYSGNCVVDTTDLFDIFVGDIPRASLTLIGDGELSRTTT